MQRLKEVAAAVPADIQVAVEFRHDSWFAEDTYAVLRAAKWAMVATHNHDRGDSPIVDTGAGFFYARLHGAVGQYIGDYGVDAMRRWAGHVAKFLEKNPGAPVYIFLNNNESHVGGLTSSVVDSTELATQCQKVITDRAAADVIE